jgi:hypothetical protein
MTYLALSLLFTFIGYKARGVLDTFRMVRDKKFIEKVVDRIFTTEVQK